MSDETARFREGMRLINEHMARKPNTGDIEWLARRVEIIRQYGTERGENVVLGPYSVSKDTKVRRF